MTAHAPSLLSFFRLRGMCCTRFGTGACQQGMMFRLLQVDVFTPLSAVVSRVWALWELLMLAEPLMVVAPTPGIKFAFAPARLCC